MTSNQQPHERIFIPLDTPNLDRALEIATTLKDLVGGVKIGKEFFTALGPEGVARVTELGMPRPPVGPSRWVRPGFNSRTAWLETSPVN